MIRSDNNPDETQDVYELVQEVFDDPRWLDLPNPNLAGETPRDLISRGSEGELLVRSLARSVKQGMTT